MPVRECGQPYDVRDPLAVRRASGEMGEGTLRDGLGEEGVGAEGEVCGVLFL